MSDVWVVNASPIIVLAKAGHSIAQTASLGPGSFLDVTVSVTPTVVSFDAPRAFWYNSWCGSWVGEH